MIKRVLVCGSRKFNNLQLMLDTLKGMDFDDQITLISGMAKGADNMALNLWKMVGLPVIECPANWNKYGRSAGMIRNQEMLDLGPELVIAFWDGVSHGTAHMIEIAKKADIPVIIIT